MYVYILLVSATALKFSLKDKMHIAFMKLTDAFLKEFKTSSLETITDIVGWFEDYCHQFKIAVPTLDTTSFNRLFQSFSMLPYHNCLNPELLHHLAERSGIECLIQSVRNYEDVFSYKKLKDLTLDMGEQIQEIKVIKQGENCTKLVTKLREKDLTVGQLHGLTAKLDERILYLKAGVTLPQWIEEGCICIVWLIPSYLVEHTYNSACININLFAELNLLHIRVGRYMVEFKDNIIGKQCK